MRIARVTVSIVAFVLLLAGCIDYEDELIINADGSAEQRVTLGVSVEFSEMSGEMGEISSPFGEDFSEEFRGEGTTVVVSESYDAARENAYGEEELYRYQDVVVRYDDVAKAPFLTEEDGEGFSFERRSDGSYLFRRRLEADGGDSDDPEQQEMLDFMSFLFADNSFSFAVEMPLAVARAEVEGAPAALQPTVSGRRVEWELPFVEMMRATEDFYLVIETQTR